MATYAAAAFEASGTYGLTPPTEPSMSAGNVGEADGVYDLQPPAEPGMFADSLFPDEGGGGVALVYRMRGYDTTLTATVFWSSDHVDSTAADYGGPGPVTNIVVQKKLGT